MAYWKRFINRIEDARKKRLLKVLAGLKKVNSLRVYIECSEMVMLAQLVRALGCGPRGRRFKSGTSPQVF